MATTSNNNGDEDIADVQQPTKVTQGTMGTAAAPPPEMIHRQTTTSTFTKTYTKTFYHYVSNNMDREGGQIYINNSGQSTIVLDFGAQYVPYDNCRASMRPNDWLQAWRNASAFRIKKHTVTITDYQPMQEQVNGTTNTVTSQFVSQPALWIYTDPQRYFGLRSVRPIRINDSLYKTNNYLQRPIPTTQQEGMLQRAMVDLGPEFLQSVGETINVTEAKWDKLNDINGMLELCKITPGQTFHYDSQYDSAECRWYPIGKFSTTELKDVPMANSYLCHACPTNTGYIEANYSTLVNHNFLDEPKLLLIKIEDYHTEQGALNITAKIKVTYTAELEFKTIPDMGFNALQIRDQGNQLNTNDTDWTRVAIPPNHFNLNRPRELTMYQVGLSYQHDTNTLDFKDMEMTMEPPKDARTKLVKQVYNEARKNFTPMITRDQSGSAGLIQPAGSSAPIPTRFSRKRAAEPTTEQKENKKLKVSDGIIIDQTNTAILPAVYKIQGKKLTADTTIAESSEIIPRQDNAEDQYKSLEPTQQTAGLWTDKETTPT